MSDREAPPLLAGATTRFDARGFVSRTHGESRRGRALLATHCVALGFFRHERTLCALGGGTETEEPRDS